MTQLEFLPSLKGAASSNEAPCAAFPANLTATVKRGSGHGGVIISCECVISRCADSRAPHNSSKYRVPFANRTTVRRNRWHALRSFSVDDACPVRLPSRERRREFERNDRWLLPYREASGLLLGSPRNFIAEAESVPFLRWQALSLSLSLSLACGNCNCNCNGNCNARAPRARCTIFLSLTELHFLPEAEARQCP